MGFMFWIWVATLIFTVVLEISTTSLTSIWFTCGAFAALILNLFVKDTLIILQVAVFTAVSIGAILGLKPLVDKKLAKTHIQTNVNSLFGKTALVVTKIEPNQPGSIKIEGVEWTAKNDDDSFEPGELVSIVSVEGNTLTVERKEK